VGGKQPVHTVTSFHASRVGPDQITAIVADYLALERARQYRRRVVMCFGALALLMGIVGLGFHWLSAYASWSTVGACTVGAAVAWFVELRCDGRLARRLTQVPGSTEEVVPRRV
jgi:hypothetical protein